MYKETSSLVERLRVLPVEENKFVSKHTPLAAGNAAPIAYGGFCIGIAVNSAVATVARDRYLFSILGQFLSPVSIAKKVTCTVSSHRETRTFSSREVKIFQEQGDGAERLCMILLLDFRSHEETMLEYSALPTRKYSELDACPTTIQLADRLIAEGQITPKAVAAFERFFGPLQKYFETRQCPEGVSGQNFTGLAKKLITTQEDLPPAEKSSAEYVRCHEQDIPQDARFGVFGFMMDAGLSFLPLVHEHLFLDDAAACASLEFAIRIFETNPKLSDWHFRERTTICGRGGLTYSEGRLWTQDKQMLVATMTQQCVLRPKQTAPAQRASL